MTDRAAPYAELLRSAYQVPSPTEPLMTDPETSSVSYGTIPIAQAVADALDSNMPKLVDDELNGGDLAHLAEINAIRQMSATMDRMASAMKDMMNTMADLKTDVAVMKTESKQYADIVIRVQKIELLHAQQAGAFSLVGMLKDYGGWLAAIATGAFALLHH